VDPASSTSGHDLNPKTLKRRGFVKICASAVASVSASPSLLAATDKAVNHYNRVKLLDLDGAPLSLNGLAVGETYVFHYPYVTTPCFLLDLGRPTVDGQSLETEAGEKYRWQGGIGPNRSIVSFCAICAHKMTHPAKSVSFINYRHEEVSFKDNRKRTVRRPRVIYCCSEKSVYDPAKGARVLGGPAPQPLAAILLEYNEEDGAIYAAGTSGGELYRKFFDTFAFRLALEHGTSDVQRKTSDFATVMTIAQYTRTQMLC
jgi:Rieske Fe-S protein